MRVVEEKHKIDKRKRGKRRHYSTLFVEKKQLSSIPQQWLELYEKTSIETFCQNVKKNSFNTQQYQLNIFERISKNLLDVHKGKDLSQSPQSELSTTATSGPGDDGTCTLSQPGDVNVTRELNQNKSMTNTSDIYARNTWRKYLPVILYVCLILFFLSFILILYVDIHHSHYHHVNILASSILNVNKDVINVQRNVNLDEIEESLLFPSFLPIAIIKLCFSPMVSLDSITKPPVLKNSEKYRKKLPLSVVYDNEILPPDVFFI